MRNRHVIIVTVGGGENSYLPGFFTAADNYIIKKLMKRASAVHVTAEALF